MPEVKKCDMSRPFAFISYAHEDDKKVMEVAQLLMEKGYNIWVDKNLKCDAKSWIENVAEVLMDDNLAIGIFFRSENSMIKTNVMKELALLQDLGIIVVDIWNDPSMNSILYFKKLGKEKKKEELALASQVMDIVNSEANATRYNEKYNELEKLYKGLDDVNVKIEDTVCDYQNIKKEVKKCDISKSADKKSSLDFKKRLNLAFHNAIAIDDKKHFINYTKEFVAKEKKENGAPVIFLPEKYQQRVFLCSYDENSKTIEVETVVSDNKGQLKLLAKKFKNGMKIEPDDNIYYEPQLLVSNVRHFGTPIELKNCKKTIDYDILNKSIEICGVYKSYDEYKEKVNKLIELYKDENTEIIGYDELGEYAKIHNRDLSVDIRFDFKAKIDLNDTIDQDKENGYCNLFEDAKKDKMAKIIYETIINKLIF